MPGRFHFYSGHQVVGSDHATASPEIGTTIRESDQSDSRLTEPWQVILFNDEVHTFEEVIFQVMKATSCSIDDAERHAWRAHFQGKTQVYDGPMDSCLRVQGVLREIALLTEIRG